MSSFLNVNLPVLLQVNRSEGGTLLPWPNGSLLSGKLMPPTEGAGAMLMLGNYRVRIEVPPNTPMGHVWLELLQREKPGQFRLLTDKQAIDFIKDLLHKQQEKLTLQQPDLPEQQKTTTKHEWAKLPMDMLPFLAEQHGERLMLLHPDHGQPQGFIQKEEGQQEFMLHGRLDLEHMGALAFSLSGKENQRWQVHIYMQDDQYKHVIEAGFQAFLAQNSDAKGIELEGSVFDYIPESMGSTTLREV